MQSKKPRPIIMNRNKTSGRTAIIIKRVLLITAVLAVIEVIVLVVIHYSRENKTVIKTKEQKTETPKEARTDTNSTAITTLPKMATQNKPVDSMAKTETPLITSPVVEKVSPEKPAVVKDSVAKNQIKPKERINVKKVTDERMFEILNELKLEKLNANNTANCVTIQIVNNSNAENGFRIATYLRKNGYIISGREVVGGSQKGIKVNATGPCIKLAIGTL